MKNRLFNSLLLVLLCSVTAIIQCACPPIDPQKFVPFEQTSDGIVFHNLMNRANLMENGVLRRAMTNIAVLEKTGELPIPAIKLIAQHSVPVQVTIVLNKELMDFDYTIAFRTIDGQLVNKLFIRHWSLNDEIEQSLEELIDHTRDPNLDNDSADYKRLLHNRTKNLSRQMAQRAKQLKDPNSMTVKKMVELPPFLTLHVDIEAAPPRPVFMAEEHNQAELEALIKVHFVLSAEQISDLSQITMVYPLDQSEHIPIFFNFFSHVEQPICFS